MKNKDEIIITLSSGKQVDALRLKEEDIELQDIAHALARKTRWNGHHQESITVGEHSMVVSFYGETIEEELWGLFHDAAEAYLGDIPHFMKPKVWIETCLYQDQCEGNPGFITYSALEGIVLQKIANKFGLPPDIPKNISKYDALVANTIEVKIIDNQIHWSNDIYEYFLFRESPDEIEARFIQLANDLLREYAENEKVGIEDGTEKENTGGEV